MNIILMASNIYTSQFATKVEVSSEINQTASQIDLNVNQKLTNYPTTTEMNSAITIKANEINSAVSTKVGENEVISKINQSSEAITINANKLGLTANNVLDVLAGNTINMKAKNISLVSDNWSVASDGTAVLTNANISGTISSNNATITGGKINLVTQGYNEQDITVKDTQTGVFSMLTSNQLNLWGSSGALAQLIVKSSGIGFSELNINDNQGSYSSVKAYEVRTPIVVQTSSEKEKKNFEELQNALNIIKNIQIYKYNFKNDADDDKKHIGFVIGKNFKYSKEVTSKDNDGVDIYSFVSVCCKAIQEQQEQIEELKKEILKLKGEK